MRDHFDQTEEWFRQTLLADDPVTLSPLPTWLDDPWFLDQDDRHLETGGWWMLREGEATGASSAATSAPSTCYRGPGYRPDLDGALLVLEDDAASNPPTFARDLTSLLQLPDAAGIRGLIIGRFQKASGMTRGTVEQIVANQPRLAGACRSSRTST